MPSLLGEALLFEDLPTLCGAEERGGAGLTFLRTGCDLPVIVFGALLCEERTAGCCCVCERTVPCLLTEEDRDVLVLSLRSASCLLTLLLLALVLADGRCVATRSLLPEAERSLKVLERLDTALLFSALLLLPEMRPDELRGEAEPAPLSLITEGREDVFAFLDTFLSEGLALLNLLTGADCVFLLYDTDLRLSRVTTSLR